jgi:hypothetical protein
MDSLLAFAVLRGIDCPSSAHCPSDPASLSLLPLGRAVFCGPHWQQS